MSDHEFHSPKQEKFEKEVFRRIDVLVTKLYLDERKQENQGTNLPKDLQQQLHIIANNSFEELCDLVKLHPARWMIYKLKKVFNSHMHPIFNKVDETVRSVRSK